MWNYYENNQLEIAKLAVEIRKSKDRTFTWEMCNFVSMPRPGVVKFCVCVVSGGMQQNDYWAETTTVVQWKDSWDHSTDPGLSPGFSLDLVAILLRVYSDNNSESKIFFQEVA